MTYEISVSLESQVELIQTALYKIFKSKNENYGNSFAHFGVIGLLIRIQDKLDRCVNLLNKKQRNLESITDTLLDTANYAAMSLCLINNNKIVEVYRIASKQDLNEHEKILASLGIGCVLLNARYKLNKFLSYQKDRIEITDISDLPNYLLSLHILSILSTLKNHH